MGLIISSAIFFFFLIYGYFALRGLLTGEPGPFDTVIYEDDGNPATYKEIAEILADKYGPQVVFHMKYEYFIDPFVDQAFLIIKSKEKNSKIRIEVHQ